MERTAKKPLNKTKTRCGVGSGKVNLPDVKIYLEEYRGKKQSHYYKAT